jgi:hypothetical protein
MAQTIATEDGILLIASHSVAQAVIDAVLDAGMPGRREDGVFGQYVKAGAAASEAIGDLMTVEELGEAFRDG